MSNRPEIAYLVQNILPLFASAYGFPLSEDETNTRIDEIPIRIGSSVKKPDVVYFHQGLPVFIIEAKKEGKSKEDAIDQALSYIKNFPTEKYSKDGIRPRYFAVTIGRQPFFFAHRFEVKDDNFKDWYEELSTPMLFENVLQEYGLLKGTKEILIPDTFRKEVLNELGPLFKIDNESKITPDVVKNIARQILSFLQYGEDFTSHRPYIDIEQHKDRQAQIRTIFNKYDWSKSLGIDIAKTFREYILRSFQGNLNQYLTPQSLIAFMCNIVGQVSEDTRVLDFECGTGGYLSAMIDRGVKLPNIRGVDIDELPYILAKTYMAIYFNLQGIEAVESIPIKLDNGLFYQGNDWDIVIGNPAGGNKYEHDKLDKISESLSLDLDKNGKQDSLSEYSLSIQQSIVSCKDGGKICLVLPEGFFSNSSDEYLRKYVSQNCRILAIISLPKGIFKKGTSVKQQTKGSQNSSQKMSVLYLQKEKIVDLNYPIFITDMSEPLVKTNNIDTWFEPELNLVLEQWKSWNQNQNILNDLVLILPKEKNIKTNIQESLLNFQNEVVQVEKQKPPEVKTKTILGRFSSLFKK